MEFENNGLHRLDLFLNSTHIDDKWHCIETDKGKPPLQFR